MEFKELSMPKVAALLISLLEEQEGVEINYKFEKKEEFAQKEDKTA